MAGIDGSRATTVAANRESLDLGCLSDRSQARIFTRITDGGHFAAKRARFNIKLVY